MNKRVVYTCVTGGYENIIDPSFVQSDFDYVCFTDQTNTNSEVWSIRLIPDNLKDLSPVKQQRIIKICLHLFLPQYTSSIYVNGSIDITGDPNDFLSRYCNSDKSVYIRRHPTRNCIYEEAVACINLKKNTASNIESQMNRYASENYPPQNGLVESGVIYRRHNDLYCICLMELWKNEIIKGSHRDQLSFNYCLWKVDDVGFQYVGLDLFNNPYFRWCSHRNR